MVKILELPSKTLIIAMPNGNESEPSGLGQENEIAR
jgi:hypothetical protein